MLDGMPTITPWTEILRTPTFRRFCHTSTTSMLKGAGLGVTMATHQVHTALLARSLQCAPALLRTLHMDDMDKLLRPNHPS